MNTLKILIAGSGRVGETLIKQLSAEGYDLTVIDKDAKLLEALVEQYDIMALTGNCASMETLKEAGADKADLLIAATGSDEINLLSAMTAHGLNPKMHTIARIQNPEYTEQIFAMRSTFGLSMIFNPEKHAADEIGRLLRYPGFLKRDSFAKGRVEIVELKIDADSKLCNAPLYSIYGTIKCRILVCAVLRDGEAIIPDGKFVLQEGDRIFVTAPSAELSRLLKSLGIITGKTRKVIIAGGGAVGYYLAESLCDSKIEVTVIESDEERCAELTEALPYADIICGDAGSQPLLASEGLESADALVTLTGNDELNAIVSMYGSSCELPCIVTRLDRLDNAKIIDKLSIGTVVSPKKLFSNTIVRYVRAMKNQAGSAITIHNIADGKTEALEFILDSGAMNCGKPLKELKLKKNVLIACITHRGKIEIPGGNSTFEVGDGVIVIRACDDVILQFNDIFE